MTHLAYSDLYYEHITDMSDQSKTICKNMSSLFHNIKNERLDFDKKKQQVEVNESFSPLQEI